MGVNRLKGHGRVEQACLSKQSLRIDDVVRQMIEANPNRSGIACSACMGDRTIEDHKRALCACAHMARGRYAINVISAQYLGMGAKPAFTAQSLRAQSVRNDVV